MSITVEMIEEIVDSLGNSFDSHKVILELAHRNQRAYVEALHSTNGEAPFKTLHSSLGKRVKDVCVARGFIRGISSSNDIFLQQNDCPSWMR